MRRRLNLAGWVWLTYAGAVLAVLASCSGCATPPPAPAAPAAGMTCRIGGDRYRVDGQIPTAAGWWSVRHLASNGRAGLMYAPTAQLEGCAA